MNGGGGGTCWSAIVRYPGFADLQGAPVCSLRERERLCGSVGEVMPSCVREAELATGHAPRTLDP